MSSAAEKFVKSSMRSSSAALCQAIGWDGAQPTALDVVSDVYSKYLMQLAKRMRTFTEHGGRTDPSLEDAALLFEDMNISVSELEEYVGNFEPVVLPSKVPKFPVSYPSCLNFLRPGSEEVVTRPVHVHEYMPPMILDEDRGKEPGSLGESLTNGVNNGELDVSDDALRDLAESKDVAGANMNGKVKAVSEVDKNVSDSDEDSEDGVQFGKIPISPQSPKTSKTGKRVESPGENPVLKRFRMLLEEENQPVKEVTSVMMTSSGFLTSSREGKLPESRPPPREFFDPPSPEAKRRPPTMRRIVEGVKKLDKEKSAEPEGLGLFEKPDNIFKATVKEKEPERVKVKEKTKDKKEKNGITLEKNKSTKKLQEDGHDKQKLAIFKRKINKEDSSKFKSRAIVEDSDEGEIRSDTETKVVLDAIDSDEDFDASTAAMSASESMKKANKPDDKVTKLKKPSSLAALRGKMSKAAQKAAARKALAAADTVKLFDTSDQIVRKLPILKRGRPKKGIESLRPSANALQSTPLPTLKPAKIHNKRMNDEADMKFVPEISINVRGPDFSPIKKIPLQPGLIPAPTSFETPPMKKLSKQFPSSLSVTPATPAISISPVSSKESSRNPAMGNLSSNVCSSVTITRIDMSNSQKLPTPFDNQSTPGIGSPILPTAKSSSSISSVNDSGITITPIVMEGQNKTPPDIKIEKPLSGLAKLEQTFNSKEQRRREKEKRKELKKEKKKEKRDKMREKERDTKTAEESFDKLKYKVPKKEKKEKSDKKKKREKELDQAEHLNFVPKLTLKLPQSSTSTPADSPNPPTVYHGDSEPLPSPVVRIKTVKPVEESRPQPSGITLFAPLIPGAQKKVSPPKKSPDVLLKQPKQEVDPFPDFSTPTGAGNKKAKGRQTKGSSKSGKASAVGGAQAGLVTETVGSYIDEHGQKIWICPACGRQDDGSPMIGCEICDDWYHFTCVGIMETPDETEQWFCKKCQGRQKNRR